MRALRAVAPLTRVPRCRRRRCPGYAQTWARDTMRKIRENLQATADSRHVVTDGSGVEAVGWCGIASCAPTARRAMRRPAGCRVVGVGGRLWNELSRDGGAN